LIESPFGGEGLHREPDSQYGEVGNLSAMSSRLVPKARASGDSGSGRTLMKRTLIAATALALAGTLAGCSEDEPKADPTPTESTSSPSATTTPEPTWDDKYSPAQLKSYRAARDRWLEYWDFYTEITRKGVDTPGVKSGFEKYSMSPLGDRSQFLDNYVRSGARSEVPPEVLWTSAERITQDVVDFNYCLDHTNSRVTVNGEVVPKKEPLLVLARVRMRKTSEGWKKERQLEDKKGVTTCTRTAP